MRCLYEVLGVERDADEDAIKRAYKKMALMWHPDKNQHRKEEADAAFKEIQNAYEVLSDKHERSWYDSHRQQILKSGERHQAGGMGDFAGPCRPEDEVDVFQYFSSSCFSGYGDGPKGFHGVYGAVFDTLASQEQMAFEERQEDISAGPPDLPSFGTSTSDSSEVSSFYNQWSHFTTCKDFSWADMYNPAAAPNRQVRRRMEEENKKARRVARKEYNSNIRELVAFVKKRDKRVVKFQAEESARRAAREKEELERQRAQREERRRRAAEYEEAEWVVASQQEADEQWLMEEEDAASEEEWYCIVCEKKFKREQQLKNHERSKKHLEKVAELRAVLEEEEKWVLVDEEGTYEEVDEGDGAGGEKGVEPHAQNIAERVDDVEVSTGEDEPRRKKKTKKKKRKQQQRTPGLSTQAEQQDLAENHLPGDGSGPVRTSTSEPEPLIVDNSEPQVLWGGGPGLADDDEDDDGDEDQAEEVDDEEMLSRLLGRSTCQPAADGTEESGEEETAEGEGMCVERGRTRGNAPEGTADNNNDDDDNDDDDDDQDDEDEGRIDEDELLARLVSSHTAGGRKKSAQNPAEKPTLPELSGLELNDEDDGSDEGGVAWGKGSGKRRKNVSKKGTRSGAPVGVEVPPADVCPNKQGAKAKKRQQKKKGTSCSETSPPTEVLQCMTCHQVFSSRNQLFKHIQVTGHASLKHL